MTSCAPRRRNCAPIRDRPAPSCAVGPGGQKKFALIHRRAILGCRADDECRFPPHEESCARVFPCALRPAALQKLPYETSRPPRPLHCSAPSRCVRTRSGDLLPVGALTFKRPADWAWVPGEFPHAQGGTERSPAPSPTNLPISPFFHFGPNGGGDVQANAQRWPCAVQRAGWRFQDRSTGRSAARRSRSFPREGARLASGGMFGTPTTTNENYALLGAIIENSEGKCVRQNDRSRPRW